MIVEVSWLGLRESRRFPRLERWLTGRRQQQRKIKIVTEQHNM